MRPENQIEGRNPVREALRARRPTERILIIREERSGPLAEIASLAREQGIQVQEVDRPVLDRRSVTGAHQGVIALVAAKGYVEVEDILQAARQSGEAPLMLLCDGLAGSA